MSNCENCIHKTVCRYNDGVNQYCKSLFGCPNFKDKSQIIELPCKVGDTVYLINKANIPQKMILDKPDIRCHCADENNLCGVLCGDKEHNICAYSFYNDNSDFGKTVFLTREEAEQALKERPMVSNAHDS